MGTLYIVSTPIGNLQDISLRAIEVLTTVKLIACEDTRHTGMLLQHIYKIVSDSRPKDFEKPTLLSYYEDNEHVRIPQIITALTNDMDVALVSDAGTPTISDPGFKLVRECVNKNIKVVSVPGPSAVISALVVSGLPTDKFLFLGYLPKKQSNRKTLLATVKTMVATSEKVHPTVIFFEAPHRLIQALEDLKEIFGDISLVVCRELTKIHEEVTRGKTSSFIKQYNEHLPRGEFVILFNTFNQEA